VSEAFDGFADGVFDDVVAEDQADRVVLGEVLGQAQCLRDAAGTLLIRVVQVLEPELAAVPSRRMKSPALLPPVTNSTLLPVYTSHDLLPRVLARAGIEECCW